MSARKLPETSILVELYSQKLTLKQISERVGGSPNCIREQLIKSDVKLRGHEEYLHGLSHTPEWQAWRSMRKRCQPKNKKHTIYFDRGIAVCPEWQNDFLVFLGHVGQRPTPAHSLDRIKNDLGYVPGNVRWATPEEQNRNRRNCRLATLNGETKTLIEWSESSGIAPDVISWRLKKNWPKDSILTTAPNKRNRIKEDSVHVY